MLLGKEEIPMRFPKTLLAFHEVFPDEEACWVFLRRMRWPRGFRCARCKGRRSYAIASRRLEQCTDCRYQASVTAGTIFHKTRVPLRTWFLAIYLVGRDKRGISALQLQRDAGIRSYRAAWLLLHKVRATFSRETGDLLRGHVEADETYLGAPHEKGRRGGRQMGRKTLVGVVVEKRSHTGRAHLAVLKGISYERDIGPFVRGVIEARKTTVETDGLDSYRPLAKAGIRHKRRVQGLDRSRSVKMFPWSHTIFSNLKGWLRGTFHGVSPKYLSRYLDEFTYRYNHRSREHELADLVLGRLLGHGPMPFHQLEAELEA
jgi:transposase-like protein